MIGNRCEQSRLAELCWKRILRLFGLVANECVNAAVVVVEQIQLAVMIFRESDNADSWLNEFLHRTDLVAIARHAPDATRFPVSKDVSADEFRKLLSSIDETTSHGRSIGMRNGDGRRHDRSRATFPLGMNWLRTFHQTPAVVVTGLNPIDQFPGFPANITRPQIARLSIHADLPRVPHSVRPDLSARVVELHERVVRRNRVVHSV